MRIRAARIRRELLVDFAAFMLVVLTIPFDNHTIRKNRRRSLHLVETSAQGEIPRLCPPPRARGDSPRRRPLFDEVLQPGLRPDGGFLRASRNSRFSRWHNAIFRPREVAWLCGGALLLHLAPGRGGVRTAALVCSK